MNMEEEDEEMEIPEEGSIAMKIFSCCFQPKLKESELESERGFQSKQIYESNDYLFPLNIIRKEEKEQIKFTRVGLIQYIKTMANLVFPVLFEESNIKISKRNYTEINGNLPLYRFEVSKQKIYFTQVPSIQSMLNAMINPELRKKWDKNIKEFKVIEKLKNNSDIIRIVSNKILAVIPEKEFYDKRYIASEGGVQYLFSTSVPDSSYLNTPNIERGTNYICAMTIKEDEDNFYFDCFNQIDVNINIPIEFIEDNLLRKVRNFFDKYFEFLNVLK
jgi:hypothetical protein